MLETQPHVPDLAESIELNLVVCAYTCANLVFWFFDPGYLNVGFMSSVYFMFLISAPMAVHRVDARRSMAASTSRADTLAGTLHPNTGTYDSVVVDPASDLTVARR